MFSKSAATTEKVLTNRVCGLHIPVSGTSTSKIRKAYSKYVSRQQKAEDEELDQKKEQRKRMHAESSALQQRMHTSYAYSSGDMSSDPTTQKSISSYAPPSAVERMTAVLHEISSELSCCNKMFGKTTVVKWQKIFNTVDVHSKEILNRSSGIVSMSTLGCVLVSSAKLVAAPGLPGVMEMAGNTLGTGKGLIETAAIERRRVSFSVLRDFYQSEVSQHQKCCDNTISVMDAAAQTIQSVDDKRNQETNSIISGRS